MYHESTVMYCKSFNCAIINDSKCLQCTNELSTQVYCSCFNKNKVFSVNYLFYSMVYILIHESAGPLVFTTILSPKLTADPFQEPFHEMIPSMPPLSEHLL